MDVVQDSRDTLVSQNLCFPIGSCKVWCLKVCTCWQMSFLKSNMFVGLHKVLFLEETHLIVHVESLSGIRLGASYTMPLFSAGPRYNLVGVAAPTRFGKWQKAPCIFSNFNINFTHRPPQILYIYSWPLKENILVLPLPLLDRIKWQSTQLL